MLENIRKYTGLFIVILVLIFVGLVFMESNSGGRGPGSGPVVVKTDDKTYSSKELEEAGQEIRLGQRILQTSLQSGSFDTYSDISRFLGTLEGTGSNEALKRYLVHRTNFEKAKKEFGLSPSKDEIDLYQREKIFTDREGIFDDEGYRTFTEKGLKGLGMTINDLNDFVSDIISFKALGKVLGAGVVANEKAARETFIAQSQQITLSTLSLELETFKKDLAPSEEEVRTYWQENQGRYLTEPKRKLTYFVATPDFEAALAAKKEEESKKEKTAAEEAAEAEKTAEEIAADTQAASDAMTLTPEERKRAVDELGLLIEENISIILQQEIEDGAKKANLEPRAEELGFNVQTTDLLPLSELPSEIGGPVRGLDTSVEKELAEASLTTGNVMDSLSEILGVGTESWLLYRIDEAVDPTEKTFEEAMEEAREDLIQERGEKALEEAIEAAREGVFAALASGKALAEAAAEYNLQVTEHLGLAASARLPDEPNPQDVFRLASQTKTGELSEAEVIQPLRNRALFVFVKEREFVESDQNLSGLDRAATTQQQILREALVQHWFAAEFDKVDVEIVTPKS